MSKTTQMLWSRMCIWDLILSTQLSHQKFAWGAHKLIVTSLVSTHYFFSCIFHMQEKLADARIELSSLLPETILLMYIIVLSLWAISELIYVVFGSVVESRWHGGVSNKGYRTIMVHIGSDLEAFFSGKYFLLWKWIDESKNPQYEMIIKWKNTFKRLF